MILPFVGDGDMVLDVSSYNGNQYHWNSGDVGPIITVYSQGIYIVDFIQSNGCLGLDTIMVQQEFCEDPCKVNGAKGIYTQWRRR
ncbi:MAG: hypothetical protein R2728_05555 [Chitinophagales bacterium]